MPCSHFVACICQTTTLALASWWMPCAPHPFPCSPIICPSKADNHVPQTFVDLWSCSFRLDTWDNIGSMQLEHHGLQQKSRVCSCVSQVPRSIRGRNAWHEPWMHRQTMANPQSHSILLNKFMVATTPCWRSVAQQSSEKCQSRAAFLPLLALSASFASFCYEHSSGTHHQYHPPGNAKCQRKAVCHVISQLLNSVPCHVYPFFTFKCSHC